MARIVARLHEKSYAGGKRVVLAACDEKLLGKKFEDGGLVLDLKKHKDFYGRECFPEERLAEMMRNANNLNLVGEKTIETARRALGLSRSGVKEIAGVPHLQVYRV